MVYECAQIADRMLDAEAAGDEKAAKQLDSRLGFLTPILKGFLTEAGKEAADLGIQVYGGHGYIQVVFGRTHSRLWLYCFVFFACRIDFLFLEPCTASQRLPLLRFSTGPTKGQSRGAQLP